MIKESSRKKSPVTDKKKSAVAQEISPQTAGLELTPGSQHNQSGFGRLLWQLGFSFGVQLRPRQNLLEFRICGKYNALGANYGQKKKSVERPITDKNKLPCGQAWDRVQSQIISQRSVNFWLGPHWAPT